MVSPIDSRQIAERYAAVEAIVGQVELGAQGGEVLLRAVDAGDRRSAGCQPLGHRRAQPAGGAGDRDHAAIELAHAVILPDSYSASSGRVSAGFNFA